MISVDSSVWITHFRNGEPELADLLAEGVVLIHQFVVGELACGTLKSRASLLSDFASLPAALRVSDADVLHLIKARRL
jgi:predicted nucleic acid-binding protein